MPGWHLAPVCDTAWQNGRNKDNVVWVRVGIQFPMTVFFLWEGMMSFAFGNNKHSRRYFLFHVLWIFFTLVLGLLLFFPGSWIPKPGNILPKGVREIPRGLGRASREFCLMLQGRHLLSFLHQPRLLFALLTFFLLLLLLLFLFLWPISPPLWVCF